MKHFARVLLVAGLAALSIGAASAADVPAKAPAAASLFKGYPYGSTGLFFGIFTEGGAGAVNGTVPGVGSASLTSTQAGVGGTVVSPLRWQVAQVVRSDNLYTPFAT